MRGRPPTQCCFIAAPRDRGLCSNEASYILGRDSFNDLPIVIEDMYFSRRIACPLASVVQRIFTPMGTTKHRAYAVAFMHFPAELLLPEGIP